MFTMSFYLLHCMLNFVLKSAHKFIHSRKNSFRKNPDFPNYEVARCPSFEANCILNDEKITFAPAVYIQRYLVACDIIKSQVAQSSKLLKVVDFGCAEVSLFEYLKRVDGLSKVLCIDIDEDLLARYHTRAKPLGYNYICPRETPFSVDILAGSVAECDPRLLGTDIVIAIEMIEHLYPHELNAVPWTIFGYMQPKVAVFTTPNVEFNVMFKDLKGFRHDDHKFEWTRREFHDWAENIVLRYPNYQVRFTGIGPGPHETEHLGCVSQMALFIRRGAAIEEPVSPEDETSKYKLIKTYDYPFSVDTRTDTEKTRDEVTHHRIKLSYLEPYCDMDVIKIELTKFLPYVDEWCKNIEELQTILESFGTTMEPNENGDLCVVGMDDERQSDEEEGYLTGDLEPENHFSEWGTYRATGDRTISPAWDVATVPENEWDDWDLDPAASTSQNDSNIHEVTAENADVSVCEISNETITNEEEIRICLASTENSGLEGIAENTSGFAVCEINNETVKNAEEIEICFSSPANSCPEVAAENSDAIPICEIKSETVQEETETCLPTEENNSPEVITLDTTIDISFSEDDSKVGKDEMKTGIEEKICSEEASKSNEMLGKKQVAKGTYKKTKPPIQVMDLEKEKSCKKTRPQIEVVDLTDNDEVMITSDLMKSNETVFPASSESCGDSSAAEGVWVISEELRYGKPKRRNNYVKYKNRKSFEGDKSEEREYRRSRQGPKRPKDKNGRGERERPVNRNVDATQASELNEKPLQNQETLPLITVKPPYEHKFDSISSEDKSSKINLKEKVSEQTNILTDGSATNKSEGMKARNETESSSSVKETDNTSSFTGGNWENLFFGGPDSQTNKPVKPKPARRYRKKKRNLVSTNATNSSDNASQSDVTLNNSNNTSGNSNAVPENQSHFNRRKPKTYLNKFASGSGVNPSNQASEVVENNTQNLLPKRLNQDKIDNTAGEKFTEKPIDNPNIST